MFRIILRAKYTDTLVEVIRSQDIAYLCNVMRAMTSVPDRVWSDYWIECVPMDHEDPRRPPVPGTPL